MYIYSIYISIQFEFTILIIGFTAPLLLRNPTNDPGGPFCYVENDDSSRFVQEYCDIPRCPGWTS